MPPRESPRQSSAEDTTNASLRQAQKCGHKKSGRNIAITLMPEIRAKVPTIAAASAAVAPQTVSGAKRSVREIQVLSIRVMNSVFMRFVEDLRSGIRVGDHEFKRRGPRSPES